MFGLKHSTYKKYIAYIILCCLCKVKAATIFDRSAKAPPPSGLSAKKPAGIVQRPPPVSLTGVEMVFDVDTLTSLSNPLNRGVQGLSSRLFVKDNDTLVPIVGRFNRPTLGLTQLFSQNEYGENEEDNATWGAADGMGLVLLDNVQSVSSCPLCSMKRLSSVNNGERDAVLTLTIN